MRCFDHLQLLFSSHFLDLTLPAHRLGLRLKRLVVGENHRAAGTGVFRAPPRIVRRDTLRQMVCPPAIERIVRAPDNIGIIHVLSSPPIYVGGRNEKTCRRRIYEKHQLDAQPRSNLVYLFFPKMCSAADLYFLRLVGLTKRIAKHKSSAAIAI